MHTNTKTAALSFAAVAALSVAMSPHSLIRAGMPATPQRGNHAIRSSTPRNPGHGERQTTHDTFDKRGNLISRPTGMPKPGPYYTTLVKMDGIERFPGAAGLTDGILGMADHGAAERLGFMGTDLEGIVDLGAPLKIRRLGLHCLQSTRVGVFLPKQVEFAVSQDGKQFQVVKNIEIKPPTEHVPAQTQTLAADGLDAAGRCLRVRAAHLGPLPEWVVRGSVPAWLFASEIVVNTIGNSVKSRF